MWEITKWEYVVIEWNLENLLVRIEKYIYILPDFFVRIEKCFKILRI